MGADLYSPGMGGIECCQVSPGRAAQTTILDRFRLAVDAGEEGATDDGLCRRGERFCSTVMWMRRVRSIK